MLDSAEAWRRAYSSGTLFDTVAASAPGLNDVERTLFDRFAPDANCRVLNLGCGAGRETIGLGLLGYTTVLGVDLSDELLAVGRRRAETLTLPIEFRQGSAGQLPVDDASVDVVTMFTNLLGYLTPAAARAAALREAARALRPGGTLMTVATSIHHLAAARVGIPVLDAVHHVYNPLRLAPADRPVRGTRHEGRLLRPRSHWFHRGEIEGQATAAGFELVLSTTAKGLLTGTRRLHGAGQLVAVFRLGRPSTTPPRAQGGRLAHDLPRPGP